MLSDGDILATNVLPAFEASLKFGATEQELQTALGWTRSSLTTENATVSGDSTSRHMELMWDKPRFSDFLLTAVRLHTATSLGVLGLACKTSNTVGEALACHQRYQSLTNQTAAYVSHLESGCLILTEERRGGEQGSLLLSDYTLLVAIQLLRSMAQSPLQVIELRSRRDSLGGDEKRAYSEFLGARIECGYSQASVHIDAGIMNSKVHSADLELAGYFSSLLDRALPTQENEAPLVRRVRLEIRTELVTGTPKAENVAARMGLGVRTLQRRLSDHELTFGALVDSTRRTLAEGYLADRDISLAEIAYLLGYVEQASFFRAFRRWHQTTPAEYRREQQGVGAHSGCRQ